MNSLGLHLSVGRCSLFLLSLHRLSKPSSNPVNPGRCVDLHSWFSFRFLLLPILLSSPSRGLQSRFGPVFVAPHMLSKMTFVVESTRAPFFYEFLRRLGFFSVFEEKQPIVA